MGSKQDDEDSSLTSIEKLRPFIYEYAKCKLYDRLQAECSAASQGSSSDSTELKFWSAFATLAQGKYEDSVHEFEKAMRHSKGSFELALLTALLHSHMRCELTDNQAISSLTRGVMKAEKRADEDSLLTTARFYMLLDPPQYDDAMKLTKLALKADAKSLRALCVKGWIQLFQSQKEEDAASKKESLQSAARSFQPALKAKTLDSLLGLTQYFVIRNQLPKALEAINQVIIRHAWFVPALLTKARLLLSMGEWIEAKTASNRCLEEDPENVEALRILALIQLVRDGDLGESENLLENLNKAMARTERKNASLYVGFFFSFFFSHMYNSHTHIYIYFTQVSQRFHLVRTSSW